MRIRIKGLGCEDTVTSSCVQRTLIDCVNVVLLVAYVFALVAACPRRRRRWGLVVVSVCCVAAAAGYGITGFQDATDVAGNGMAQYLVRGLVWIALAVSLHAQPTRLARAVAVLWWGLFSVLITAYNAMLLAGGHRLNVAEVAAWPVNFLHSLLQWRSGHHQDASDDGLLEPRIDKDETVVHTSEPVQPACLLMAEPSAPSRPHQGAGPRRHQRRGQRTARLTEVRRGLEPPRERQGEGKQQQPRPRLV
jgi:hypothetical protein